MTLTICFITKDKADKLKESLENMKSLADEILVLDTGSKDATLEVAKEYGAQTISWKWKDDFSAAKNACIEAASKEWILFVKPGETIAQEDQEKFKEAMQQKDIAAYITHRRVYTNNENLPEFQIDPKGTAKKLGFKGFIAIPQVNFFQRKKEYQYQGMVFEDIIGSIKEHQGEIQLSGLTTRYMHKDEVDIEKQKAKQEYYLKLCLKEVKKQKSNPKYHYQAALIYKADKKFDKALEHLNKIIEIDPDYHNVYAILGDIYEAQNEQKKAMESYEKSIKHKPRDVNTYLALANIYLKRGRAKDTMDTLQKAIHINPYNPIAYYNLVVVLLKLKKTDAALKMLDFAYSETKQEKFADMKKEIIEKIETRKEMIKAAKEKDYTKTEKLLKEEFEKNPQSIIAATNLAAVYNAQGNHEKVIATLDPLMQKNKDDNSKHMLNVYNNLASAYLAINKKKEALTVLEKAASLEENSDFFEKRIEKITKE